MEFNREVKKATNHIYQKISKANASHEQSSHRNHIWIENWPNCK